MWVAGIVGDSQPARPNTVLCHTERNRWELSERGRMFSASLISFFGSDVGPGAAGGGLFTAVGRCFFTITAQTEIYARGAQPCVRLPWSAYAWLVETRLGYLVLARPVVSWDSPPL